MKKRLEPARLTRALQLQVERIPDGYRVSGGRQPHHVRLTEGSLQCDCRDAAIHPELSCKHLVAAVIYERLGGVLFAAVADVAKAGA